MVTERRFLQTRGGHIQQDVPMYSDERQMDVAECATPLQSKTARFTHSSLWTHVIIAAFGAMRPSTVFVAPATAYPSLS